MPRADIYNNKTAPGENAVECAFARGDFLLSLQPQRLRGTRCDSKLGSSQRSMECRTLPVRRYDPFGKGHSSGEGSAYKYVGLVKKER